MQRAKEIKDSLTGAFAFIDQDAATYKLKILGRGEELFFQKGDEALICDISARFPLIDPASIKRWDNRRKITEDERIDILSTIIGLYKQAYKDDLEI